MPLATGSRFGSFEVVAPLGAGGMGEVYQARDTRLNRSVALKVLLELTANDPEHLARFRREAQVLASLNHPGIAAIYGFEEANGVHALVLELVEGPTLADRIARGPIPVDEALPIALQIAEALEAAHELGIVHRDLKPANIKVSDQDVVKVLDFGLAKAINPDLSRTDVTQTPTLTVASTRAGVILGTAAYMAPEQARGKSVDRRADVWAFGCVLFEMLTGRRAFEGEVISETIAAVLRGEPEWNALPASTPWTIRELLRRCLVKEPRERLQAIGDARIEIKKAMAGADEAGTAPPPPAPTAARPNLGLMAAVAAIAAILAGGAAWLLKPAPATTAQVTRSLLGIQPFERRSPAKPGETRVPITRRDRTSIALTPDGRTLVIRALGDITEQLYVRPLDKLEATPLAGTERTENPFISPDGAWVGYAAGAELKKIPIAGGVASTITRIPGIQAAPRIFGASWGPGDLIVFATDDGLWQVNAGGGDARRLTTVSDKEYRHTLPHVLPDGRAVLYTVTKAPFRWTDAQIVVRLLESGEQKVLIDNGADPRYASSGHLVFVRSATLMAVPFNIDRLEVTGNPIALVEDVQQAIGTGNTFNDSGSAQVAIASTGRLVYATGGPAPSVPRVLVWVDRDGKTEALQLPERQYTAPRIAPDGRRIAVSIAPDSRVWVYDLQRGGLTAVTDTKEFAIWNIWSPDGQRIAYTGSGFDISLRAADGTGTADLLYSSRNFPAPSSWSSDGQRLAFVQREAETLGDVWVMDLTDPKRPRQPFVQTAAEESFPAFSADGKWIAYTSTQSGRGEIYVQPYPGPGPRVQISTQGGNAPTWTSNGAEIVYIGNGSGLGISAIMAVAVKTTTTGLAVDAPRKLFEGRFNFTGPVRGYDVTPDGRRFLMVQPRDPPPQPPVELVMVENWFEELKRSSK
jgi:eukaryotic-like serine/threonine-protein kinase